MKILLINPPITVFKGGTNPRICMPLGLLYIAAQLEKEGYDVELFDALLQAKVLRDRGHPQKWHFGERWEVIAQVIEKSNPNIVGISSIFSSQIENTKMVARMSKEVNSSILTVAGGPHPSACPQDMLSDKNIDFVVVGEGEYLMPLLLKAIEDRYEMKNIPGLCTRYRGEEVKNLIPERIEDLDNLPFPAYHLYDMQRYFLLQNQGFCARPVGSGKREVSLITSRGCPYNCVFCSVHSVMGKAWRPHSAKYVLEHIEFLKKDYDIDFIHFDDDNFSLDRRRFEQILDGLSASKWNIRWEPSSGLRADSLDEVLIKKAIVAGCQNITIAIESGVQRVLNEVIDKRLDLAKVIEVAKICKRLNVELYAFYVIGLSGETLKEIRETLIFAKKMLFRYFIVPQISYATPIFGSRLYDICKEQGYFSDCLSPERLAIAFDSHGEGLIKTKEFSPQDLKHLLAYYNRLFVFIIILNFFRRPRKLLLYSIVMLRNKHLLKRLFLNW